MGSSFGTGSARNACRWLIPSPVWSASPPRRWANSRPVRAFGPAIADPAGHDRPAYTPAAKPRASHGDRELGRLRTHSVQGWPGRSGGHARRVSNSPTPSEKTRVGRLAARVPPRQLGAPHRTPAAAALPRRGKREAQLRHRAVRPRVNSFLRDSAVHDAKNRQRVAFPMTTRNGPHRLASVPLRSSFSMSATPSSAGPPLCTTTAGHGACCRGYSEFS